MTRDTQTKHVVIEKSVKRVSLQRYLISKIVFYPEEVQERDIFALYQNQIDLEGKCDRERDFLLKFGRSLEVLSRILREVNLSKAVTSQSLSSVRQKCNNELSEFLIPKRNYLSFKNRFGGSYHLVFQKPKGVPLSELPAKRHIGVGYRDKGSARKDEIDASPAWQEIAVRISQLEGDISRLKTEVFPNENGTGKIQVAKLILSKRKEIDRIRRRPQGPERAPEQAGTRH
jgi:hypothetical protein